MNFISAEEFLKQDEKVQKVLIDWWNKNKKQFDIYFEPKINLEGKILIEDTIKYTDYYMFSENQIRCIGCYPLLQMHQLIQFIENNTDKRVLIDFKDYNDKCICDNYYINLQDYKTCNISKTFEIQTDNLLQALWKVATRIAEECFINEIIDDCENFEINIKF